MKNETKQKIKEFYERHKLEIVAGSLIIGGIIIATILKPQRGSVTEILAPEWVSKWKQKCDEENLLYANGLPAFADSECTTIYKDALHESYSVEKAESDGFIVIDRA